MSPDRAAARGSVSGDPGGPWLTLIHGGLAGRRTWERQARALGAVARVVTCELRGYGYDGDGLGVVADGIADHAEEVVALWDELGLDRGYVVGFSVGGMVAQDLALRAPERVAGLVLVATAGRVGAAARLGYLERAAAIEDRGLQPSLDALLNRALSRGFRARQPEVTAHYRDEVASTPALTIAATLRAVAAHDRVDRLGTIRCPALVVSGDQDPALGVDPATELRDRIPGATMAVVPDAGHTLHVERPSTFTHLITDFLAFDGRPPPPAR